MNAPLTRQHRLLAAVGHVSRFRLFLLLAERERCVTELAGEVGLSQSCTTRHIQALVAAGVVRGRRDGKRVRVRLLLERPEVAGLLAWARLGALAEATTPTAVPARAAGAARPPRRASPAAPGRDAIPTAPVAPISGTYVASEHAPPSRAARNDLEDFLL